VPGMGFLQDSETQDALSSCRHLWPKRPQSSFAPLGHRATLVPAARDRIVVLQASGYNAREHAELLA
jgi:hypothetical protein